MNKEMLKKQISRFLVTGSLAVLTDTIVYYLLIFIVSTIVAKGISFVSGTILAYVLNKRWTFNHNQRGVGSAIKFSVLYLSTLGANICVNELVLSQLNETYILAFLAATGTSTVLNFIGQKWWVFRK
jgi:putative flippase GtrA